MKKSLVIILGLLLLVGCNKPDNKDDYTINVLTAKGAPCVSLLGIVDDYSIVSVDGSEVLQASLINENSGYDVIVAPINLGCKLISANKSKYKLYAVVTWGNLYIVSNSDSFDSTIELNAFGQAAVPEKILNVVYPNLKANYASAVSDVAMSLISKKINTGLVAEPVCSNVLSKRSDLHIVVDLQKEYQKITGMENYPQAAIFVLEDTYNQHQEKFEELFNKVANYLDNADATKVREKMQQLEQDEKLKDLVGVNSALIKDDTYQRMNIHFSKAKDVKNEVLEFIKLFNVNSLDNIILGE